MKNDINEDENQNSNNDLVEIIKLNTLTTK